MEKHINYLYSLKVHNHLLLCISKRRTFIIGFAAAVKSILQIAKDILVESSMKYLMTYRFSQDHLELFFAQVRRRNSWNNNPNVMQFTSAIKSLLVKNSISTSANSNCVTFETENEIGLFQLRWAKNNYTKWHNNVQWETSNDYTIDDDFDSDSDVLKGKLELLVKSVANCTHTYTKIKVEILFIKISQFVRTKLRRPPLGIK
ncbi:hypothetical protein X777_10896 [Ooceraea biroi]|uniref:Transposable element P transposase-like RNase H C-terminal domain-containing protein n=1 Tax=Ooceraea biroi TaxID=2015173 RepID=A0A026W391_OOCBI|nr:hypothetical protein X777_10896 [Ooceraea biroi]